MYHQHSTFQLSKFYLISVQPIQVNTPAIAHSLLQCPSEAAVESYCFFYWNICIAADNLLLMHLQ